MSNQVLHCSWLPRKLWCRGCCDSCRSPLQYSEPSCPAWAAAACDRPAASSALRQLGPTRLEADLDNLPHDLPLCYDAWAERHTATVRGPPITGEDLPVQLQIYDLLRRQGKPILALAVTLRRRSFLVCARLPKGRLVMQSSLLVARTLLLPKGRRGPSRCQMRVSSCSPHAIVLPW